MQYARETRLGGAISKNSEKLSQWGCFFVYFDEKFDNLKFREVEAGVSLGGLEEIEYICQLTLSLTANF